MWLAALGLLSIGWSAPDADVLAKIDAAVMRFDSLALETIIEESEGYSLGVSYFRLSALFMFSGKEKQCQRFLALAIETLQPLETVEAKALLAHAMGMHIEVDTMSAFKMGPAAMKLLDQAREEAPTNPRVQMFYAVHKLNLPWILGGSTSEALAAIDKSIANYEGTENDEINWGLPDAHVWRGIILMEMNQPDQARVAWAKALEISPGYGRAEHLLSAGRFFSSPGSEEDQIPAPMDSN
jgi:tetratricopeptide (TPR) repeat protein